MKSDEPGDARAAEWGEFRVQPLGCPGEKYGLGFGGGVRSAESLEFSLTRHRCAASPAGRDRPGNKGRRAALERPVGPGGRPLLMVCRLKVEGWRLKVEGWRLKVEGSTLKAEGSKFKADSCKKRGKPGVLFLCGHPVSSLY